MTLLTVNREPSSENIEKKYFSIGEVSKMLKLPQSLIRFWEKEIDAFKPHKTQKGTRKFSKQDIQNLRLIHHLVKEKGFTLQGANEQLKKDSAKDSKAQMLESLKKVKGFLTQIKKEIEKNSK